MFGKHKRYSVFVLLPRTENSFTCKTEHQPLPYRSLQVRNKKSGIYSGVGECYNKDKWANSYYVRNVVEILLESRLHFAHKLARNLISRLNIVNAIEIGLTNIMRIIENSTQKLLQLRLNATDSANELHLACLNCPATVVVPQRIYTCTM